MRFVGFIAQRLVIKSEFRCGLGKILVLAMILIAMKCGCNVAHPSFLISVGPPKEDIGLYLSHYYALQYTLQFFMLDLCGQLSCTASTPVFPTCGYSSCCCTSACSVVLNLILVVIPFGHTGPNL